MDEFLLACVAGHPIDHSLSPALHTSAMITTGISGGYRAEDVTADQLASFIDDHPEYVGISCTMPLKVRLVELARERSWTIDPTAHATGVANTFVRFDTPLVTNTDIAGIAGALRSTTTTRAAILGSGATAASAVLALHTTGCEELRIFARNQATRARLAELARARGIECRHAGLDAIDWSVDAVVSTLPTGVPLPIPEVVSATVLDVAYAYGTVGAAAAERGAPVVSGLVMLVEQAIAQFELFVSATGRSLSCDDIDTATVAMYEAAGFTK